MEDKITLEFENGDLMKCAICGIFDVEGKDYIALEPLDGSDDVYIYGYKEKKNDKFELEDIDDEKEFKRAVGEFDEIMK